MASKAPKHVVSLRVNIVASFKAKGRQSRLFSQLDSEPPVECIGTVLEKVPFALPKKWKWATLGTVCKLYQPKTISTKKFTTDGEYPVYGANGIIGRYSSYNHEYSEIAMACRGATCGAINITKPKAWITGNAMVIHPIGSIDRLFLSYSLQAIDINSVITGTAQPQITRSRLSHVALPVPPLEEQTRIVEKLEQAFAQIDRSEKAYQELKVLSKFLREQIIQLAITGKLVPQLDSEPKVEINSEKIDNVPFDIPKKWAWVSFRVVATLLNGRAYKKNELLTFQDGRVPVLRVGNFFTNDQWYFTDIQLPEDKYCEKGDLLYAWSASFGPKIWDGDKSVYHYHIWKVLCSDLIDKKWLYYWLMAKSNELRLSGHGLVMVHITKKGMEEQLLALPPIEEQRRIVKRLEELLPNVNSISAL